MTTTTTLGPDTHGLPSPVAPVFSWASVLFNWATWQLVLGANNDWLMS